MVERRRDPAEPGHEEAPDEGRQAPAAPGAVLALQQGAGNHAVARAIRTGAMPRMLSRQNGGGGTAAPAPEAPAREPAGDPRIPEVIAARDIGGIKAIADFSSATDDQRVAMIEILLDQFWVGPYDELALERIWNSFGSRLPEMMATRARLWRDCVDRGAELPRWTRWDNLALTCEIQPGVISSRQVDRFRARIGALAENDYLQLRQLMHFAGSGMEMAFICKAVAADRSISDVATFAETIRGQSRAWLLENLNVVGMQTPAGGTSTTGISQQWQMSCGPTTVQAIRAESDPIFALSLHAGGDIHAQDQSNAPVTQGQATILQGQGSTPTPIGTAGSGAWVESDLNALRNSTGVRYTFTAVTAVQPTNPAEGDVDRAVDRIVGALHRDIAVPLVIGGTPGQTAHYVIAMRARGNDDILVHDPADGNTDWVTRAQFLANNLSPPLAWSLLAGYDKPDTSS